MNSNDFSEYGDWNNALVKLKGDFEITRELIAWCYLVELLTEFSNKCFDHLKK